MSELETALPTAPEPAVVPKASVPRMLLHAEGAALVTACLPIYFRLGGGWGLLLLCILAPDLSALGYLVNPRVGSICYNLAHTYLTPLILTCTGFLLGGPHPHSETAPLTVLVSLIWAMHIGLDRVLGMGLKYPTAFKDTHLQHV